MSRNDPNFENRIGEIDLKSNFISTLKSTLNQKYRFNIEDKLQRSLGDFFDDIGESKETNRDLLNYKEFDKLILGSYILLDYVLEGHMNFEKTQILEKVGRYLEQVVMNSEIGYHNTTKVRQINILFSLAILK